MFTLTDREFAELRSKYVTQKKNVTPDMRAHGLRMKLFSWINTLSKAKVKGIKNQIICKSLKQDLTQLVNTAKNLKNDLTHCCSDK